MSNYSHCSLESTYKRFAKGTSHSTPLTSHFYSWSSMLYNSTFNNSDELKLETSRTCFSLKQSNELLWVSWNNSTERRISAAPICTSAAPPYIFGILQPWRLKFGVQHPVAKIYFHKKFQPNRTSSFWVMANFPWFFGHFEDSFLLSLFLLFFPHIWPYLWNYWSDWTEIFCESRFWPSGGTHQISAFKVEGCRRYWVVCVTCKVIFWCAI